MPPPPYRWRLPLVTAILHAGGVIAYPTEGVWGLGCDPANADAVNRLLALKGREMSKGLILISGSLAQAQPLLDAVPPEQLPFLERYWPGFVTCLVPDPDHRVPQWIRGEHDSVALRVSAYPPVQALCDAWGGPLVSTSCNPAGRPPAGSASQVRRYFGNRIDGIFPGACGGEPGPSPILDLASGRWLR